MRASFDISRTVGLVMAALVLGGCGRDPLQPAHSTPALMCPTGDDLERAFGVSAFALSPGPSPCSSRGAALSDAKAMQALVTFALNERNDDVAEKYVARGLRARSDSDRREVLKDLLVGAQATALINAWMSRWLNLPAETPFPARFAPQLWQELRQQTLQLGHDVLVGGAELNGLISSRRSLVSEAVAAHYGLRRGSPLQGELGEISFPEGRVGVLGHAAVLGSHASVSSRGSLLFRRFLRCESVPPPPPGLPAHASPATTLMARAQLEQELTNPSCQACHQLLDAGFALHSFDENGRTRMRDIDGRVIRTDARVHTNTSDFDVAGLEDLSAVLSKDPVWHNCLAMALLEEAEHRTQMRLSDISLDGGCDLPQALGEHLRNNPSMLETAATVSTLLFGGTLERHREPTGALPPMGTQAGVCTPVHDPELSCSKVCGQQRASCQDSACESAGTVANAFLFASRNDCEDGGGATVSHLSCDEKLNVLACTTDAPLRWVRCCCV